MAMWTELFRVRRTSTLTRWHLQTPSGLRAAIIYLTTGDFVDTPSTAGRPRSFNGRYVLLQRSAAGQSEVVGHPEHSSRALKSCRRALGASSRSQSLSLPFAP